MLHLPHVCGVSAFSTLSQLYSSINRTLSNYRDSLIHPH